MYVMGMSYVINKYTVIPKPQTPMYVHFSEVYMLQSMHLHGFMLYVTCGNVLCENECPMRVGGEKEQFL